MKISNWASVASFGVGTIFDLATTVLGIAYILGGKAESWILGIAVTIVVFALTSRTREAFIEKQWWLLPLCVLALVFDFYTSLSGEQYLPANIQGIAISNWIGWLTLVFIAFFFVASPILLLESIRKLESDNKTF